MENSGQNKENEQQNQSKPVSSPRNNDSADYGDDTIGENTELTPLAKEILKERDDKKTEAKDNQENKDLSEKNG